MNAEFVDPFTTDEHLDCFLFFIIMNKVAKYICVGLSLDTDFYFF